MSRKLKITGKKLKITGKQGVKGIAEELKKALESFLPEETFRLKNFGRSVEAVVHNLKPSASRPAYSVSVSFASPKNEPVLEIYYDLDGERGSLIAEDRDEVRENIDEFKGILASSQGFASYKGNPSSQIGGAVIAAAVLGYVLGKK